MQQQTLRHLIVVAICCAGVAALYLMPQPDRQLNPVADPPVPPNRSVPVTTISPSSSAASPVASSSMSPRPVSSPYDPEQPVNTSSPRAPESSSPPAATSESPTLSASTPPASRTTDPTGASTTATPGPSAPATSRTPSATPSGSPTPTPTPSTPTTGSTPPRDTEQPDQVTGVAVSDRTATELSLSWVPATDDRGVDFYEVFLNGYPVGQAKATRATVPWLNDSLSEYLLTVRAVDTSGNAGLPSAGVPVVRPEPEPSASPSAGESGPPSAPPTRPSAPESRKGTP